MRLKGTYVTYDRTHVTLGHLCFSISNLDVSTPSALSIQCSNHMTVSLEHISTLKRGRDVAIDKNMLFFFLITEGRR